MTGFISSISPFESMLRLRVIELEITPYVCILIRGNLLDFLFSNYRNFDFRHHAVYNSKEIGAKV